MSRLGSPAAPAVNSDAYTPTTREGDSRVQEVGEGLPRPYNRLLDEPPAGGWAEVDYEIDRMAHAYDGLRVDRDI